MNFLPSNILLFSFIRILTVFLLMLGTILTSLTSLSAISCLWSCFFRSYYLPCDINLSSTFLNWLYLESKPSLLSMLTIFKKEKSLLDFFSFFIWELECDIRELCFRDRLLWLRFIDSSSNCLKDTALCSLSTSFLAKYTSAILCSRSPTSVAVAPGPPAFNSIRFLSSILISSCSFLNCVSASLLLLFCCSCYSSWSFLSVHDSNWDVCCCYSMKVSSSISSTSSIFSISP